MYTPTELLAAYPHLTLTINSTEDTRKTACKGNYAKYAHLDPDALALRYEPDTDYLFVDASWLDQEIAEDLFKNTQYKGKSTVRFMKGTGHNVTTRTCHVFDLKATSALRTVDHVKHSNYRRALLRDLKGDIPAVAEKMREFEESSKTITDTQDESLRLRLLQQRVKALEKDILRMLDGQNPISYKRSQRRKYEALGHMEALTNYIRNHKPSFSADVSKLEITNRIPEHRTLQYLTPHTPLGVLKETTNTDGSNHKKRLYIAIHHLKKLIPNYRRDSRYITSQTTYIKHQDADGNPVTTNIYCAVFDLLRAENKQEAT